MEPGEMDKSLYSFTCIVLFPATEQVAASSYVSFLSELTMQYVLVIFIEKNTYS